MYLFRKTRRKIRYIVPVEKNLKNAFLHLEEEEQKELCRRLKGGDTSVRDRLAASFYGIALYIAAQYGSHRKSCLEDLFSESLLGVALALDGISEMYDDDIRPYVMSKIQTRCANYFKKSDDIILSSNERYRRMNWGDHRIKRPINATNMFLDIRPCKNDEDKVQKILDDIYEVTNTRRRKLIVDLKIQGYTGPEIAKYLGISTETVRLDLNEVEYRYYSLLAKRIQEERQDVQRRKHSKDCKETGRKVGVSKGTVLGGPSPNANNDS